MYKKAKYNNTTLKSVEKLEGEPLEWKIERIVGNNEPITDGAPEIFTERKDGIAAAHNIRTDRWEIAADAMDHVSGSVQAKREARAEKKKETKEAKVVKMKPEKEVGGAKTTEGTND